MCKNRGDEESDFAQKLKASKMKCKILTPDLGWKLAEVIKEFRQVGGQFDNHDMVLVKLKDRNLSSFERERISLKRDVIFEKKSSIK
tara:strand:- start:36 stop:296 length:261 start_codon:yes stop_codon:yes gene_type:complete